MIQSYTPRTGSREGRGAVTLSNDRIMVSAPVDYGHAGWLRDPTTRAGYVHAFLRPFRAVVAGFIPQPGFVIYPFVDAAPLDGLRCPGAICVYRNRDGAFTFVFFPAIQKMPPDQSEVDHLTAHIDFEDGLIVIGEIHAKVRLAGEDLPTKNLQLKRDNSDGALFGFVKNDDHHLAFECWSRDVRYFDPAGILESTLIWSPKVRQNRKEQLRAAIESSIPRTIACSAPTQSGLVSVGAPVLVRVGLLTEKGRVVKGGVDAALSEPHGTKLGVRGLRLQLYRDIRGIDPSWPEGVSMFVEVGLLQTSSPNDHNLPDVRGSLFKQLLLAPAPPSIGSSG